jgi:phage shock protein E
MNKLSKSTQLLYAALVLLSVWLFTPLFAGGGDIRAAREAWPMIENGALLVDVRSKEEFDEGHLEGAIHIEWTETDKLMAAIGEDKQRPVVFYCRTGNRADKSIAELKKNGYTNIFNATGLEALQETRR